MRVLINALSARRGGIVTYTRQVASALADQGIEVTLATPPGIAPPDGPYRHLAIEVARLRPLARVLWEQFVWRRTVMRLRPDVLFSSANFSLLSSPVPQVLLLRESGLFEPFYLANVAPSQGLSAAVQRVLRRRFMLRSARAADQVITPSETTRAEVLRWDPSLESKISAIHYGAPSDAFAEIARPPPVEADRAIRLLYVSVYYPHKVPRTVCRALDILAARGIEAEATITMDIDELRARDGAALDRAILGATMKTGRLRLGSHEYQDLASLYAMHDFFVFPSINETFGHPMVEAMAAGMPTIAADTPINREICGDAAIYFEPLSATGLATRVSELAADPALQSSLSERGRRRARDEFRWEAHTKRLIETFERARLVRRPARANGGTG